MDKDIILQLMKERHSVREYRQIPIEDDKKQQIITYMEELKKEAGLEIFFEERSQKVFGNMWLKVVGWKKPPAAYFALCGDKNPTTEEKCGYYGEKLVLFLQSIGLHTCWVGLFNKKETTDDTLITIAVGYGENAGRERKTKTVSQVSDYNGDMPAWFLDGVNASLLAPTAINRQAFQISGDGNQVSVTCHNGSFSYIDMGIVKYHFEQGAGTENFEWV